MPRVSKISAAYVDRMVLAANTAAFLLLCWGSCSEQGTVREAGQASRPFYAAAMDEHRGSLPRLVVEIRKDYIRPVLDGVLDEKFWKSASCTGGFVDPRDGGSVEGTGPQAQACLAANKEMLFVSFQVKDPDVIGGFVPGKRDQHLWTRDTVEIMTDPEGDGDNLDYYEIQVNPQNLVFDSFFDSYNKPRAGPNGPFGHQDWNCGLESSVKVLGTLDRSSDTDQGYSVETAIPWSCFNKARHVPPVIGTWWRMNFYAIDQSRASSWSPILGKGNFHKAERFGIVEWK